jgi:hypothetical protein
MYYQRKTGIIVRNGRTLASFGWMDVRQSLGASPACSGVDASVISQYFPTVNNTPGYTQNDFQNFCSAVASGYFPESIIMAIDGCTSAASPTPSASVSTGVDAGGSALMKLAPATGPAAPFVAAAGSILQVIGSIFSAKAQLEKTEDQVLCQQLQNFNAALQQIDAAVNAGTLNSAGVTQAYAALISAYNSAVTSAGIIAHDNPTNSSGGCDAACVFQRIIEGILAQRAINLQANSTPADQSSPAASSAGSAVSSVADSLESALTGMSPLVWIGAAAALFLVFSMGRRSA